MKPPFLKYSPTVQMAWKNTVLCMILFLSGISCDKTPNFDLPTRNKIVILAEVTAGSSAYIPISQAAIIGSGAPLHFAEVTDASVAITGNDGSSMQLQLSAPSANDSIPGSVYTNTSLFDAGTEYYLTVAHPLLGEVKAATYIPSIFTISRGEIEESEINGQSVMNFNFTINDNGDEENYYLFEALRQPVYLEHFFYWKGVKYNYDTEEEQEFHEQLEDEEDVDIPIVKDSIVSNEFIRLPVFTKDLNTANTSIGALDSSFNRIFIDDKTFNGRLYAASFSVPSALLGPATGNETGRVVIRIKSADKNFYRYMLQYEKYKTDFGKMPIDHLNTPSGNISNGLGVFGGVYKNEWSYNYEDLD